MTTRVPAGPFPAALVPAGLVPAPQSGPSRRQVVAVLGGGLAGGLWGCRSAQPDPVDFSGEPRGYVPKDYEEAYAQWTRHDLVVDGEGLVVEAWATLKSYGFREAFVEKYAEVYALSQEEKEALWAAEREAAAKTYEVVLAAQMNDFRSNDLEDQDSAWRVYLVDAAGDKLEPVDIDGVRLPNLYQDVFFPKHTAFSRTYVIRFDQASAGSGFGGPESGQLGLWLACPRGIARLTWEAA